MVTTLGRTGSTWLLRLLNEHPQIVAYRPFQYEPRVLMHWMRVLKGLANPASYLRPVVGGSTVDFWVPDYPLTGAPLLPDPALEAWLGGRHVEDVIEFCQQRIEGFYRQACGVQNKADARYFVEKVLPDEPILATAGDVYGSCKEIVLVRDFRDMIASIFAFNAKRGTAGFGREVVADDEAYIEQQRQAVDELLERWKRVTPAAFLLRYEDLVIRPEETLPRLLRYLEADQDPTLVSAMISDAARETPESAYHRTAESPQASIGRWERDLSEELKSACTRAFGPLLRAFGYAS
jgi:hypothetical protein